MPAGEDPVFREGSKGGGVWAPETARPAEVGARLLLAPPFDPSAPAEPSVRPGEAARREFIDATHAEGKVLAAPLAPAPTHRTNMATL